MTARFIVILALVAAIRPIPATAKPLDPAAADKAVEKLLVETEHARPGGIFRVQRFPVRFEKGWKVQEAMGDDKPKTLEATAGAYFYFVDKKAGPMYSHAVEFLLVDVATGKISRQEAGWMPKVLNAKGEEVVEHAGAKLEGWYTDAKYTALGGAGASIQDAQQKVKWDWMMAQLPAGSNSLVLYSCPATLPKGGTVRTGEGDTAKTLFTAEGETFLVWVEFGKGKPFPRACKLIAYDRASGKATTLDVDQPPRLVDAAEKDLATDDAGKPLGAWFAADEHSFLSRMSFGGR